MNTTGPRRSEIVAVYAAGLFQGLSLVAVPAAATILTSADGYDLSASQYGLLFLPQVALSDKSGIQAQQDDAQPGTAVTPDVEADQPIQAVGAAAPTSTAPPAGTAEDPRG